MTIWQIIYVGFEVWCYWRPCEGSKLVSNLGRSFHIYVEQMHKIVRILYNIQTWGLAKEENEEVGKWIRCGGAALCGFWQPPC